jgi:8-oxo-dGTP diphosphatase
MVLKQLATPVHVPFHLPHIGPDMPLPYKIATLLYCFNERDEILLLERAQEPNLGFWSPCGGKLHTDIGESPYACACREATEEIGLRLQPADLHLTGIVSEHGYQGQGHWLMFLFEVRKRLTSLPPVHREGRFSFFSRADLAKLKLPQTDAEKIWPWFWQYRGGFFAAHCHCLPDGHNEWTLEESMPGPARTPEKNLPPGTSLP